MVELRCGMCCGTCEHSSKPKTPSGTHTAHYDVSKTERWCYKHNQNITRETLCDDYSFDKKSAGARAATRAFSFNRRARAVLALGEKLGDTWVPYGRDYLHIDGPYIVCTWSSGEHMYSHRYGPKENNTDRYIKVLEAYVASLSVTN